ncbi:MULTISPECIES: hypothetical protein [unclassified Paenibacillus]|uniref:hypothetical protein n=1 Tax=unclassified Paenibacillus TaxID=185978 RepID=UPI002405E916|nr:MULTISPECIES: hypothetical protein [unclassified Paenibacillus]MDF9842439.1 hypothetical protein [Paenibacillus sp. PastF-2]MDF9849029.1 hypothetical protein [Paenibacillus sp. PastM-2]MDF9855599.1 hypothetical protein [Paenibacillus sp. PastF-1]MDH6480871.1 hypothetical protein [Paenibacillus sp. PastH-2]MDH6508293.1 hypothetical protein [Paenibacillus sp. PastM-3]
MKMNKKWLVAAVAAGMALTGSAGVYAGAKLQEIKAYLNNSIGVVVDGTPYWLRDGNGKTLRPITYEGLTYLPVRSVAEALDVPITYDAVNYKVRIGIGADAGASNGSGAGSGSGSGTAAPVESTMRPVNLPQDFPIPSDAIIATTLDTDSGGVKKAAFSYSTQESLETMGFVYSEYAKIKRLDNASQTVSATTVKITGRLGGTSPVSITGKPSTARPGFNIFTITWSES